MVNARIEPRHKEWLRNPPHNHRLHVCLLIFKVTVYRAILYFFTFFFEWRQSENQQEVWCDGDSSHFKLSPLTTSFIRWWFTCVVGYWQYWPTMEEHGWAVVAQPFKNRTRLLGVDPGSSGKWFLGVRCSSVSITRTFSSVNLCAISEPSREALFSSPSF